MLQSLLLALSWAHLGPRKLQESSKRAQGSPWSGAREPQESPESSKRAQESSERAQDRARRRLWSMKKTNVSSEVLIFQSYSVKSRPRSKHSSFSHGKYECFERGLDFTEQALKKQQKTHTHGSMKKTNVSSEVLILPKINSVLDPFWAHFGLHFQHIFHHFWDPFLNPFLEQFWDQFGAILEPILEPYRPKRQARRAQERHQELKRANKLHFQKP